jgi:hypothetical protein
MNNPCITVCRGGCARTCRAPAFLVDVGLDSQTLQWCDFAIYESRI